MSKEYVVHLNERQIRLVNLAIEEWLRIRLNQWDMVADYIALCGYKYDKDDPMNSIKFNEYIRRRDATGVVLKAAMEVAQPNRYYDPVPKTEEHIVLEDIWQVIRYELDCMIHEKEALFSPRTPFIQSSEPAPVVEVNEVSDKNGGDK